MPHVIADAEFAADYAGDPAQAPGAAAISGFLGTDIQDTLELFQLAIFQARFAADSWGILQSALGAVQLDEIGPAADAFSADRELPCGLGLAQALAKQSSGLMTSSLQLLEMALSIAVVGSHGK